jgi:hypothetical protein
MDKVVITLTVSDIDPKIPSISIPILLVESEEIAQDLVNRIRTTFNDINAKSRQRYEPLLIKAMEDQDKDTQRLLVSQICKEYDDALKQYNVPTNYFSWIHTVDIKFMAFYVKNWEN